VSYYDHYDYYKPSKPRKVKNGITARSRTGRIGREWWSKKWLGVVESYGKNWNRLERGRRYARSGQVIGFKIEKGKISGKVQGSMKEPYSVTITVKKISDDQWKETAGLFSKSAAHVASLLAGQMPEDIDRLMPYNVPLFPVKGSFLPACTCPDSAVPCKHIAAMCYIIAEELDKDPFLLFKLRGMEKDCLLREVRLARGRLQNDRIENPEKNTNQKPQPNERRKPIRIDPKSFWSVADYSNMHYNMNKPTVDAAIIKRLGEPKFWRARKNFVELMENSYKTTSYSVIKELSTHNKNTK